METYLEFSEQLTELENKSNCDNVYIELCSEGGEAYAALAFYSRMRSTTCPIYIKSYGLVASAAVLILAAGGHRQLSREAWVMVHEDEGTQEGSVSLLEVQIKQGRRLEDQWNTLLSSRTNTTSDGWAALHKSTTYLSAEECLKLGLIDEII